MIDLAVPVVGAPMAGGTSTPELAAAVTRAGGLGFLGAGYLTATGMREQVAATRALLATGGSPSGGAAFGVNLFDLRGARPADPALVAAYAATLPAPRGEARFDDDDIDAKLAALVADPVAVVSFTFGCPPAGDVAALRRAGTEVWVTVTTRAEADLAVAAGADALVAQGAEAGGHRGTFADDDRDPLTLLALLQLLRDAPVPVVAAGGIATPEAVAAVLRAGAVAAQVGTALMLTPEAGTNPAQRARLGTDAPTALTRAFTGRLARGIVNDFLRAHPDAPSAYPEIHHLTAPARRRAREAGDADGFNLWAGQAHALAEALPAAEVVARLASTASARSRSPSRCAPGEKTIATDAENAR